MTKHKTPKLSLNRQNKDIKFIAIPLLKNLYLINNRKCLLSIPQHCRSIPVFSDKKANGLYNYSKSAPYDGNNLTTQLIYNYYLNRSDLSRDILISINTF
jgi:hypothetical protein